MVRFESGPTNDNLGEVLGPPSRGDDLFYGSEVRRVNKEGFERIPDMEPLDSIAAPAGWSKQFEEAGFGQLAKSISYNPGTGEDAKLSLFDRGTAICNGCQELSTLQDILRGDPRDLTRAEISSLGAEVLGPLADRTAFGISSARIAILNGKKVLAVEGNWLNEGKKKYMGFFIPKNESARNLQEVYFEGAPDAFTRHRPAAQRAIESIRWQN